MGNKKPRSPFGKQGWKNLWFAWLDWPLPADLVLFARDVPGNPATARANDNVHRGGHCNEVKALNLCHSARMLRQSSAQVKPQNSDKKAGL